MTRLSRSMRSMMPVTVLFCARMRSESSESERSPICSSSFTTVTLERVEAVFAGDREKLEAITHASIPEAWPGRVLVERAFSASLDAIRADPPTRLWGDRLVITASGERLVVGSVIFHGRPADG